MMSVGPGAKKTRHDSETIATVPLLLCHAEAIATVLVAHRYSVSAASACWLHIAVCCLNSRQ